MSLAAPVASDPADRPAPTVAKGAHAYAELLAADEARRRAGGLARLRSMAHPIQASD